MSNDKHPRLNVQNLGEVARTVDLKIGALSARHEQLLMKYVDGEVGPIGRFRAERVISKNPNASLYIDSLLSVGNALKSDSVVSGTGVSDTGVGSTDLWARVDQRLEQERLAARVLGNRQFVESSPGFFARVFGGSFSLGVTWGASGALVAASLVFVLINSNREGDGGSQQIASYLPNVLNTIGLNTSGLNNNQASAVGNSSFPADSAAVSRQVNDRPRIIEQSYPSPLEVDWMRSSGRLRMIQDPQERSTIIWVRKRQNPRGLNSNAAGLQQIPFPTPDLELALREMRLRGRGTLVDPRSGYSSPVEPEVAFSGLMNDGLMNENSAVAR